MKESSAMAPAVVEAMQHLLIGTLSGLVPKYWQQSAQAAEHFAGLAACNVHAGQQEIISDCAGVVRLFRKPPTLQLAPSSRFSGIARAARGGETGWKAAATMQKIKTHRHIETISDPLEKHLAIGNAIADNAAKLALVRHPSDAPLRKAAWDLEWEAAAVTAELIAKVGRLWPPARPPPKCRQAAAEAAAQRTLRRREKSASEASNAASHRWTTSRGIKKCAHCGVCLLSPRQAGILPWRDQLEGPAGYSGSGTGPPLAPCNCSTPRRGGALRDVMPCLRCVL